MDAEDFRERLRHGLALPARHVQREYVPELAEHAWGVAHGE